ncbi:MAG: urocanate hydratase, partial [Chitinophagaceae bacterium]|nr:urocanate hydratase [Chitinophagaceae bacterium]
VAEVEEWRIDKRIETKYLDEKYTDIDEAIDKEKKYKKSGTAKSIGVHCNAVHLLESLLKRDLIPDTVTDQTSAHDPLIGYIPHTLTNEQANVLRNENPEEYLQRSYESMFLHVQYMLQLMDKGAITFDYGNNIRARADEYEKSVVKSSDLESKSHYSRLTSHDCFAFPGFVPAYIRPLFCEGKGPFRWAALSGDPKDIDATDEVIQNLFPENKGLMRWLKLAKEKIAYQGLPARICWLG